MCALTYTVYTVHRHINMHLLKGYDWSRVSLQAWFLWTRESPINLIMVTVLILGDATHTLLPSQGQIIMLALYVVSHFHDVYLSWLSRQDMERIAVRWVPKSETTSQNCFEVKLSPRSNWGFICECIWVKPSCKSIFTMQEALLRFTVVLFSGTLIFNRLLRAL